jgi:hypothetical protein
LYSGQEVLTSADCPMRRLVRASGKWKEPLPTPPDRSSSDARCSVHEADSESEF